MTNNRGFSIALILPILLALLLFIITTILPGLLDQLPPIPEITITPFPTDIADTTPTSAPTPTSGGGPTTSPVPTPTPTPPSSDEHPTATPIPTVSVPLTVVNTPPVTPLPTPTPTPGNTDPPPHGGGDWTRAIGRPIDCPADKASLFEVHTWWEDENEADGKADDFGHIHAATCYPFNQPVGSTLNLELRITMHNNPSSLRLVRFDNQSGGNVNTLNFSPHLTCPITQTCTWIHNVSLDTSKFRSSALRIRATVETPDGKRWVTSTDWQVAGGRLSEPLQGKGWYESPVNDYAIAQIDPATIPTGPVSGTHVFRVKTKKASKRLRFWLNRQHALPAAGSWKAQPHLEGRVIEDIKGDVKSWLSVPIDTRQLQNGWHAVQIMSTNPNGEASRCSTCDNEIDLLSGGQKIWFEVRN